MSNSEFRDLSDAVTTSEDLPPETSTVQTRRLIVPGRYVSPSRSVKVKSKPDGNLVFELTSSERMMPVPGPGMGDRPVFTPRTWVSTKVFERTRDGVKYKTSQAHEYLEQCRIKPPRSPKVDEWKSAFAESQHRPVGYRIGWENEVDKNPDGSYPKAVKHTKDFNSGTKEQPIWNQEIEEDGLKYRARERVEDFFKV